jgi:ABC-type polysaccharide/polyol phosphate export permease
MVHPSVAVLERHVTLYRRFLWKTSVFSFFVTPVLFLVSIGLGVGSFVSPVDGFSYLKWITPGLLTMLAFQIGVGESTYSIRADLTWVGGLYVMRNTRVRIRDMIVGKLLYILVLLALAVSVFLAVTVTAGAIRSWGALVTPLVCVLVTLSAAAPTTAFSASIDNDGYLQLLFRFAVVPATLFSGVFFPVEAMPAVLRPLAYVSPIWHGVELNRAAILGTPLAWPAAAHVAALLVWTAAGFTLAHRAYRRRLSH